MLTNLKQEVAMEINAGLASDPSTKIIYIFLIILALIFNQLNTGESNKLDMGVAKK